MLVYRGDDLQRLVDLCRPHTSIILDEVSSGPTLRAYIVIMIHDVVLLVVYLS